MPAIPFATRKKMILKDVRAAGPEAMAIFKKAFAGKPENLEFAAMCALRTPSGSRYTDRALDQGTARLMGDMHPINRKRIYQLAKKAGIDTTGKAYNGALGRCTDPAAWITGAEDVRRAAKARNLTVEGALNIKGYMPDPIEPKGKKLAPDLVAEMENRYITADPSLAAKVKRSQKERRKLREMVVDKHGRKG